MLVEGIRGRDGRLTIDPVHRAHRHTAAHPADAVIHVEIGRVYMIALVDDRRGAAVEAEILRAGVFALGGHSDLQIQRVAVRRHVVERVCPVVALVELGQQYNVQLTGGIVICVGVVLALHQTGGEHEIRVFRCLKTAVPQRLTRVGEAVAAGRFKITLRAEQQLCKIVDRTAVIMFAAHRFLQCSANALGQIIVLLKHGWRVRSLRRHQCACSAINADLPLVKRTGGRFIIRCVSDSFQAQHVD